MFINAYLGSLDMNGLIFKMKTAQEDGTSNQVLGHSATKLK